MNKHKLFLLGAIIALSSCAPAEESTPPNNEQPPQMDLAIPGGSPSLPVAINLAESLEISSNSFTNYFKYTAVAGEKLVIHTTLSPTLEFTSINRCINSRSYFIHIYTESLVSLDSTNSRDCDNDRTYEFSESSTYILQFDYPVEYSGFANIASIGGLVSAPLQSTGRPDNPATLNLTVDNTILNNTFYNYYKYTAVAGEKLVIHTTLSPTLETTTINRCINSRSYFIHIYTESLVSLDSLNSRDCDNDRTYEFEEDGTYILQFDYPSKYSGFASVASI